MKLATYFFHEPQSFLKSLVFSNPLEINSCKIGTKLLLLFQQLQNLFCPINSEKNLKDKCYISSNYHSYLIDSCKVCMELVLIFSFANGVLSNDTNLLSILQTPFFLQIDYDKIYKKNKFSIHVLILKYFSVSVSFCHNQTCIYGC